MINTLIDFLTLNKEVIGLIIGIGESIVVIINLWRKHMANKKLITMGTAVTPPSCLKLIMWSMNPLNLFSKA